MRTAILNGTLVSAAETLPYDLYFDQGSILGAVPRGDQRFGPPEMSIDATGKYVLPGGVDVHTHLDLPMGAFNASDDYATGTLAAAHGGTTTIIDFVNHARGESLLKNVEAWHQKAAGRAVIDYGFHMTVAEASPQVMAELPAVVKSGISSVKVFFAYPERLLLDDPSVFRVMQRAADLGALVLVHAEDGPPLDILVEQARGRGEWAPINHALTRPEVAEATGTERAIALAEMAHAPVYIVHVSCARALTRIVEGKSRGLTVWGETCPQYLCLSEDDLRGTPEDPFAGAKFVCTPPLRPKIHQEALWRGLAQGHLDTVATDHCPFNYVGQKDRGRNDFTKIPNGLPGIETRLHLLYEAVTQGKLSLERMVEVAATAPAKIFGLYPKKGSLLAGADADLVIWDPIRPVTLNAQSLHMRVDYSTYEGRTVPGSPMQVYSRGELLIDRGCAKAAPGRGRFLARAPA